ncbi:MAG: hypothetical protein WC690_10210 [bacterium]
MMGWGPRSLCGEELNLPPGGQARCQPRVTAYYGTESDSERLAS